MRVPTMKKPATTPASINELLAQIDERRDEIATLRADRAKVENAPRPFGDIMADVEEFFDRAATSAIDCLSLHHLTARNAGGEIRLSQSGHPTVEAASLFGLLILTNRDKIREVVAGQIEDMLAARPALEEDQRQARLAQIDREILTAELAEEGALRALELQGVSIARRADLNPLIALAADSALAG